MLLTILIFSLVLGYVLGAPRQLQAWANRMRRNLRPKKNAAIFSHNYLQSKEFYLQEFGIVPSCNFIENIDAEKVAAYIHDGTAGKVTAVYQSNYYNWNVKSLQFTTTLFVLEPSVMIEVGAAYVEVLFAAPQQAYANHLMEVFSAWMATPKKEAFEINIITLSPGGLALKQLDINPTELDLDLYYNDDFKEVDAMIRERLGQSNDKGIVLLHGLPGTGKTTYLRHLIGTLQKKVLFVSPGVAENLMNPEFLDLLIDNPNAVLIIEDAENIIMDRQINSASSVSNLLNLSDGLLSDCLNVQIICTFNSAMHLIDSALTRKGRLIAKYEFGKLATPKAQRLSKHLGFDVAVNSPLTLAEIANPGAPDVEEKRVQVMGFRREVLLQN